MLSTPLVAMLTAAELPIVPLVQSIVPLRVLTPPRVAPARSALVERIVPSNVIVPLSKRLVPAPINTVPVWNAQPSPKVTWPVCESTTPVLLKRTLMVVALPADLRNTPALLKNVLVQKPQASV